MTRIVTILADGFADWETALLNAVARSYYGVETVYATPDRLPVTSMGGMTVTPGLALADIGSDDYDALIVCGGTAWEQPGAPDISALLRDAAAAGKVVGGICAGSYQLARAGLLDTIPHTSNGRDEIAATGYGGGAQYRETPEAVRDGRIVTAAGVAPVSFMAAVMDALGLRDANLDFYIGLHAGQHGATQRAAA